MLMFEFPCPSCASWFEDRCTKSAPSPPLLFLSPFLSCARVVEVTTKLAEGARRLAEMMGQLHEGRTHVMGWSRTKVSFQESHPKCHGHIGVRFDQTGFGRRSRTGSAHWRTSSMPQLVAQWMQAARSPHQEEASFAGDVERGSPGGWCWQHGPPKSPHSASGGTFVPTVGEEDRRGSTGGAHVDRVQWSRCDVDRRPCALHEHNVTASHAVALGRNALRGVLRGWGVTTREDLTAWPREHGYPGAKPPVRPAQKRSSEKQEHERRGSPPRNEVTLEELRRRRP